MTQSSRRVFLGLTAAGIAGGLGFSDARGQSGGLLERARRDKVIKIGIVNQPPYSELKPDGTIDGASAVIVRQIMEKLGIPKVEALTATYGQLIPGLQAGRWDMIGASLVITKERCTQVRYADPIIFGFAAFGYVKADMPAPPPTIKELGAMDVKIGLVTGANYIPFVQKAMKDPSKLIQYPDDAALAEGLLSKRHQVTMGAAAAVKDMQAKRNHAFDIVYPVTDTPNIGSGPAFRTADTDLFEPYQAELRKMLSSGEIKKIVESYGLEGPTPGKHVTNDQACAEAI